MQSDGLQVRQVLDIGHVGEQAGVVAQVFLQRAELGAELLPSGGVERAGKDARMPFRRERADDLVEDDDGDAGEVDAVAAVAFDRLAGQGKELMDACQGRLVAFLRIKTLRCRPRDQLDVKLPGGRSILVPGVPTAFRGTAP